MLNQRSTSMSHKLKKQQDRNFNDSIEQTGEKQLMNNPSQYSSVVERLNQKYLQKDNQNENSKQNQISMTPNIKKFYNSIDEKKSKNNNPSETMRKNKLLGSTFLSRNSKSFNKSIKNAVQSSSQNKKGSYLQKTTDELMQEISVFSLKELQLNQRTDEQQWEWQQNENSNQVFVIQPIKDKDKKWNTKNELQNLQKLALQQHKLSSYIQKSQTTTFYEFEEVLQQNYEYLLQKNNKERKLSPNSHSNDEFSSFKNIQFNSKVYQQQFNASLQSINNENQQNFFYAHLNTLPIDNASNYLEQKTFQNYGNFLQNEDKQKLKDNIFYKSLKKILKQTRKQINDQKQQNRQDSKLTGFFQQNTDRITKNEQNQISINVSILMLYKNELYDLLCQEDQTTNQFNFTFKNQNAKRKQMVFQNCFYKYENPMSEQYIENNQYEDFQNNFSEIIQFKKLTGNKYFNVCNKNDIIKLMKTARINKQDLSLKLKLDLNELTKLSGIYVKVQINKKSVSKEEKEIQFIFLEMPATNIFNNQNQFDSVKSFVSESHKSLQQMCKILQQVKNNGYCKIKNNIKTSQHLQQSLLALLLQGSLLFSNPCQAVLNLSVPSDLKNWHVSNLSLDYISQIREKTINIANSLQNQDILVQTLNTIDEELTQIDTQVIHKINNMMDQEQLYKNAIYSYQEDNPQMLIHQNEQEAYNQNINDFYGNIIKEDQIYSDYDHNSRCINEQDEDTADKFKLLIQIYKEKLQKLRRKNEGDANLKIDNQIEINAELQKIKYRIEQIQNHFGIAKINMKEPQIQSLQHTKILDNTFQSTPQQRVAQLSSNYHQFLQNHQKENGQNKSANRVSFSPSNQSSKQLTSQKLASSQRNLLQNQDRFRKDSKNPKYFPNENLENQKFQNQLISLSEQKQSKAMRTLSSRKDDIGEQIKYLNNQSRKSTEGQKIKKGSITSPNTPQNLNSKNKKYRNSVSRKTRTAGSSQLSRKQTSLSPNFKRNNSKNHSKQKRQGELINKKINLNNSSTTKSLKNSVKKEGNVNKYSSISRNSNEAKQIERQKSDLIINIENSKKFVRNKDSQINNTLKNSENYKNEHFKDIKTQNRLNYLMNDQMKNKEQNQVQVKNQINNKMQDNQSRNENKNDQQKKVDFSFQKLESNHPRNDLQIGFRKMISDQSKNILNSDSYDVITQRIEKNHPTLFCVDEKHIATQDSQFYGNVVGDTIQPYNNPLQSQMKINQSLEANQFRNTQAQGSFQKKSQALLEQYRQKKNSILKNQNQIKHSKKSSQKLLSRDSQKGSKLQKRESSVQSEKDFKMSQNVKNIQNIQLNQNLMVQKIEIKHLKENLQIAQQIQIGMEKALTEEIKQIGLMIKEGDENQIYNKLQELLDWKVKSKIKRNKLIIKLMEERRQRKRVQAQRDLLLSKESSKNSHKKNASNKSSKKSRKQSRSNKSKSILSNKSNFMNGISKLTELKSYSISKRKELSKSRNGENLKKNKTMNQKDLETSQLFSQPSSCNRGKSQISFNLNRTAGEIEERSKSKKKVNSESFMKMKSHSLSSTQKIKKSRSIQKTIDKQNEVIDLLEKENIKLQQEYVKQIQHAQNVQQHLEQQLIEIKEHLLTQESQRLRLQTDIDNLKNQNQILKDQNQEKEDKIKSMKTEKDYVKEIKDLNEQLNKMKIEKEELQVECERLANIEQAKDSYRKECLQLREENKELTRQVLAYQKSIKAKNTDWSKSDKINKDLNYKSSDPSDKKSKYHGLDGGNSDKENVF